MPRSRMDSSPRPLHEWRENIRAGEYRHHEKPASGAEQCAAGERESAGAATREDGAGSHYRSASERIHEARSTIDIRSAFDRREQSSGEQRGQKSADDHATDFEQQPFAPRSVAAEVAREVRIRRR